MNEKHLPIHVDAAPPQKRCKECGREVDYLPHYRQDQMEEYARYLVGKNPGIPPPACMGPLTDPNWKPPQSENAKLRDLLNRILGDEGPDLDAYLDGHVVAPSLDEARTQAVQAFLSQKGKESGIDWRDMAHKLAEKFNVHNHPGLVDTLRLDLVSSYQLGFMASTKKHEKRAEDALDQLEKQANAMVCLEGTAEFLKANGRPKR